ncbi:c-di-GMP-binding flagellar brake protein YcgR [Bacillus pakistanensis]|uniref:C-di-GMP-binding flagellar brake protein YcgR n=1 Tax=Rossellomorea pakistanensis TaxID=992288 RepID=A0ABS2N9B3_9BACI|nr:flagellar brake domain-containing protein [Bacillus pakistanensis]MBM7584370.1 c-di-GMP-binding flagellar brake protein YcgR [Bacillus pakistanensis]
MKVVDMIKIGTVLTLEPIDQSNKDKYKCKLVEFEGSSFFIDYPIHTSTDKTVFLLNKTRLKVSFVYNEKTVYFFETEVTGRVKKKIPMIELYFPGEQELVKIQRRQFVRVETAIDACVITESGNFPTITDDISAGGCALLLRENESFTNGEEVSVLLVVPLYTGEYHYLDVTGRVVRIWEKGSKRLASIEFFELSEVYRRIILRLCFDRQRMLKKKGLAE